MNSSARSRQQHGGQPVVVETLIIGAGISGIGAAIQFRNAGLQDFLILEKAEDLGGTWRDNTYPGCECDVPSHLYSYSFAQKPDWSRVFAGHREILDYVRQTAEQHGILPFIRFSQPMQSAQWEEDQQRWQVTTPDRTYYARTVVACTGYLHEPILPDIPGLAEFPGPVFHSSRWAHDHDLRGESVAVIGTGASAIQFVPKIQPAVGSLYVYQRTPQWILPKPNRKVSEKAKAALRKPLARNLWRSMLFGSLETFGVGFRHPWLLKQFEKYALAHLKAKVPDPELRAKLTPDYVLGCKRTLMSNAYYPALCQPNVELLATGVKAIHGNRVIGQDGSEREVDSIVLGTGFQVTEQPIAKLVHNADGVSLAEHWQAGMQAYRGTTVQGFPNLFLVLGPNLGIGHNSAFVVIEAQLAYITSALCQMRDKRIGRIEVEAATQQQYNERIQKDLQQTVWNTGGCSSYYLDKNGFNSIGFPWSTLRMQKLLKKFDCEAYRTEGVTRELLEPAA